MRDSAANSAMDHNIFNLSLQRHQRGTILGNNRTKKFSTSSIKSMKLSCQARFGNRGGGNAMRLPVRRKSYKL